MWWQNQLNREELKFALKNGAEPIIYGFDKRDCNAIGTRLFKAGIDCAWHLIEHEYPELKCDFSVRYEKEAFVVFLVRTKDMEKAKKALGL